MLVHLISRRFYSIILMHLVVYVIEICMGELTLHDAGPTLNLILGLCDFLMNGLLLLIFEN